MSVGANRKGANQRAESNLEANDDYLSKVLKLEEEKEPGNGRRVLRTLLGFFSKDETLNIDKGIRKIELLNRIVVD